MSNFRTIDRETGFLLPPSVDEWLPEKHLARFVVEVVDGLDLRAMSGSYRGGDHATLVHVSQTQFAHLTANAPHARFAAGG